MNAEPLPSRTHHSGEQPNGPHHQGRLKDPKVGRKQNGYITLVFAGSPMSLPSPGSPMGGQIKMDHSPLPLMVGRDMAGNATLPSTHPQKVRGIKRATQLPPSQGVYNMGGIKIAT